MTAENMAATSHSNRTNGTDSCNLNLKTIHHNIEKRRQQNREAARRFQERRRIGVEQLQKTNKDQAQKIEELTCSVENLKNINLQLHKMLVQTIAHVNTQMFVLKANLEKGDRENISFPTLPIVPVAEDVRVHGNGRTVA